MSPSDKPAGEVTGAVDMDDFGGGRTDGLGSSSLSDKSTEQGSVHDAQAHNAGLRWAGVGCAMRSYDHDCGG